MNPVENYSDFVKSKRKPASNIQLTDKQKDLLHFGILAAEEAGEALGIIKKHCVYGKPLVRDDLLLELGDLRFALEALCQVLNTSLYEIESLNINKLSIRYKHGYSDQQALDRVDQTEAL